MNFTPMYTEVLGAFFDMMSSKSDLTSSRSQRRFLKLVCEVLHAYERYILNKAAPGNSPTELLLLPVLQCHYRALPDTREREKGFGSESRFLGRERTSSSGDDHSSLVIAPLGDFVYSELGEDAGYKLMLSESARRCFQHIHHGVIKANAAEQALRHSGLLRQGGVLTDERIVQFGKILRKIQVWLDVAFVRVFLNIILLFVLVQVSYSWEWLIIGVLLIVLGVPISIFRKTVAWALESSVCISSAQTREVFKRVFGFSETGMDDQTDVKKLAKVVLESTRGNMISQPPSSSGFMTTMAILVWFPLSLYLPDNIMVMAASLCLILVPPLNIKAQQDWTDSAVVNSYEIACLVRAARHMSSVSDREHKDMKSLRRNESPTDMKIQNRLHQYLNFRGLANRWRLTVILVGLMGYFASSSSTYKRYSLSFIGAGALICIQDEQVRFRIK
eukprot:CAMPEP_0185794790 /NCGR_PEP_ID=MMETSP1174-20130828/160198_1 /TAXON_ID=35687 /ORGANISM="Dictyocha speculum, Strain CCMP1381" /LENGTH=445 /DNA_ID=CAMNT_0028490037 /DNA_START=874 /DNA_END=2211 /DNA_ORIENTATION=+